MNKFNYVAVTYKNKSYHTKIIEEFLHDDVYWCFTGRYTLLDKFDKIISINSVGSSRNCSQQLITQRQLFLFSKTVTWTANVFVCQRVYQNEHLSTSASQQ